MEITTADVTDQLLACARDAGAGLTPQTRILDFGCGSGDTVRVLLDRGFDAYGADIDEIWKSGDSRNSAPRWEGRDLERFGVISSDPYRLPFGDDFFDVVLSNQVFEHVMNYREAFQEIRRVLKPGGTSIHLFPSRWKPLEGHTNVPFASVFRPWWYLAIFARLGVRHPIQAGKGWRETADQNTRFLTCNTNYPTNDEIRRLGMEVFGNLEFLSDSYIRHHVGTMGRIGRMLPLPGVSSMLSLLGQRLILMRKW